ncbi:MAG: hypothetical protein ACSLFB_02400 [Acidimicrobiales bacterium]
MIGWEFPSNNDGQELGPNHPGIEHFLDRPLSSLAREICQNACDAADDTSGGPVEVHFSLDLIDRDQVPGLDDLSYAIERCALYWARNRKGKLLFDRAAEFAKASKIPILRISDYNTTGLTGSGGAEDRGSNWYNLIRAVYASDKPGGALGSFGIGKFAPFACSGMRTVFYSTKDLRNEEKFEGVSILATHEGPDGHTTQNTGYYCKRPTFREIKDRESIPEYFRRDQKGTDIFVVGFVGTENWEQQIVHALLDNFFKSIFDGNLVVQIGDRRINRNNLSDHLAELSQQDKELLSPMYFRSLTDPNRVYYKDDDFDGLGKIELHLLSGPGFPKRVAMLRRSGMVVFHKGHFRTPVRFAGVLQLQGLEADQFFQGLEPPAHNKWEAARDEHEAKAATRIRNLYTWVNDCVRDISAGANMDRQDVPGVGRFLPDEEDDADLPFEERTEDERADRPKATTVELKPKARQDVDTSRGKAAQYESGDDEGGESDGESDWTGDGEANDVGGGVPPEGGTGGRGDGEGGVTGSSHDEGESPSSKRRPLILRQQRCYCSDPKEGKYELIFGVASVATNAYLSLRAIGESEVTRIPAVSARLADTGEPIPVSSSGEIGPVAVSATGKCRVEVTLPDHIRCALEIIANED